MLLNINIDQEIFALDVPDQLLNEMQTIVADMDAELDRGVQMGRYWVETPSDFQRCQVVANRLVNAYYKEDKRSFYMMSAYILRKIPNAREVVINTGNEIQEIDIVT